MKQTYAMIALCLAAAASGQVTEDLKLTATDAAESDEFGISVAISGTTGIVGSAGDDDGGSSSGSAYIFDTTTGQQLFKLTASDAAFGDLFGSSVATSGTTVIIGARLDDDAGQQSGSAYVFDTTTGLQFFKLTASDAAAGDEFGRSVGVSGTTAIIGARGDDGFAGSAYVFDTTAGQPLFKLTPDDAETDDHFGWSVAISGTTALVGAFGDDGFAGSAYVFDTTTGQQLFKLSASDRAVNDWFGSSVAISGTAAIVGAYQDDDAGTSSGSAYVFDTTTGQQRFKLTASDAARHDAFGYSVGISGNTAVVGAWGDGDGGDGSGSCYVFDVGTGEQLFKLAASDAAELDRFGYSLAFSANTALVGAQFNDDAGFSSGSAYVFNLNSLPCPGDIADDFGTLPPLGGPDGMVSFGDFLALLGLIGPCPGGTPGCDGDIADDFGTLNGGDAMVSFGDFLALLGLIGPCP